MTNNPYAPARPQGRWKPTVLFWIVAAVLLLVLIPFAVVGGLGIVLFLLGLVVLLTGLYALLFKRRSWIGLPHRKSGGLAAVAGFVVFALGFGIVGATAAPRTDADKAAAVTTVKPSATATPTPTPTVTNPANSKCTTAASTQKYNSQTYVCTLGNDERLVWMTESDSKRVLAEKAAAEKAAADKAAAEKAAAEQAAAEKAAADEAAADKAAADKAAADAAAAQQAAAQQAAQQAAKAVPVPAPAAPVVPAPVVPAPAAPAPAPAAPGYVTPGAFCSGGTGISKTGKPMVCAPAKDGRMRWLGA